jgi:hypothetical protein
VCVGRGGGIFLYYCLGKGKKGIYCTIYDLVSAIYLYSIGAHAKQKKKKNKKKSICLFPFSDTFFCLFFFFSSQELLTSLVPLFFFFFASASASEDDDACSSLSHPFSLSLSNQSCDHYCFIPLVQIITYIHAGIH